MGSHNWNSRGWVGNKVKSSCGPMTPFNIQVLSFSSVIQTPFHLKAGPSHTCRLFAGNNQFHVPYSCRGEEIKTLYPKLQTKIFPLLDWASFGHMPILESVTSTKKKLYSDWFKPGYPHHWQMGWYNCDWLRPEVSKLWLWAKSCPSTVLIKFY